MTPSLRVDRIGGWLKNRRSARFGSPGGGGSGGGRSCGGGSLGGDCEALSPHDMRVGQTVVLMKRPMTVVGWDETAHVWWEQNTGESAGGRRTNGGMGGTARLSRVFRICWVRVDPEIELYAAIQMLISPPSTCAGEYWCCIRPKNGV